MVISLQEDIDVEAAGNITITAGAHVFLGSEVAIQIDQITAGDRVVIKGDNGIFDGTTAVVANIIGDDLVLEGDQDSVGTLAAPITIDLTAGSVLTARTSQDVYVTEVQGDLLVDTIFAGQHVQLIAVDGSILDGQANFEFENVDSESLTLDASGSIGTLADHFDVKLDLDGSLTATAGDGVFIRGLSLLNVSSVTAETGDVRLLVEETTAPGDDLIVQGSIVAAGGGSVTLLAGDDIELATGGSIASIQPATPLALISLQGDHGNNDPLGTVIDVNGVVQAAVVELRGNTDDDDFHINYLNGINPGLSNAILRVFGGGASLDDHLVVDDSADLADNNTANGTAGVLTFSTLTGLGMGGNGLEYSGIEDLDILLGQGNEFLGGVRLTTGDVNCDGLPDLITASGPGRIATIRVFDGTPDADGIYPADYEPDQNRIASFDVFPSTFRGGAYVTVGDINRDGCNDIVVGSGKGAKAQIKVYDGESITGTPTLVGPAFLPFGKTFRGGVTVAAADINLDGYAEVVAGSGPGLIGQAAVFDGQALAAGLATKLRTIKPFGRFRGGVFVAVGDVNHDVVHDIIVSAGAGYQPSVKVYSGANLTTAKPTLLHTIKPYARSYLRGVRVAVKPVDGGDPGAVEAVDIIMAPGSKHPIGNIRRVEFDPTPELVDLLFMDKAFLNGMLIG